jgi:hypothetical protein
MDQDKRRDAQAIRAVPILTDDPPPTGVVTNHMEELERSEAAEEVAVVSDVDKGDNDNDMAVLDHLAPMTPAPSLASAYLGITLQPTALPSGRFCFCLSLLKY